MDSLGDVYIGFVFLALPWFGLALRRTLLILDRLPPDQEEGMYSSVRSTIRDVEEATRWNDSGDGCPVLL